MNFKLELNLQMTNVQDMFQWFIVGRNLSNQQ